MSMALSHDVTVPWLTIGLQASNECRFCDCISTWFDVINVAVLQKFAEL